MSDFCHLMDCSLPGSSVCWFSRKEYWYELPCPPPGDLPDPGIVPASLMSPALAGGFLPTSATWEAWRLLCAQLLSHFQLFATQQTVASQSPLPGYLLYYLLNMWLTYVSLFPLHPEKRRKFTKRWRLILFVLAVLVYLLSLSHYLSLLHLLQELEMGVVGCHTTMPLTAGCPVEHHPSSSHNSGSFDLWSQL